MYQLEFWVSGKGEASGDAQAVKVHVLLNHEPNANEVRKAGADATATYRRWFNEWPQGDGGHKVKPV